MINGILECLKIFHARKFEFIRDFNAALESIMQSSTRTPLIIFTLSDSQEKTPSFHAKVFSREILSQKGKKLVVLNLNPPTERNIEKVLKNISICEELTISDNQIQEIKNQCNKDLRNAISTL